MGFFSFRNARLAATIAEVGPGSGSEQSERSPAAFFKSPEPIEHGFHSDSQLQIILEEELSSFSFITGAAVALLRVDGMRCRARIGGNVPAIGTDVQPGVGLTGLCLQTGKVQLCNDVHEDTRVDVEVCKVLGIKSLLVLPVKKNATLLGVIVLASNQANVFDEQTVTRLSSLSDDKLFRALGNRENSPMKRLNEVAVHRVASVSVDLQKLLAAAFVLQQEQHQKESRGKTQNQSIKILETNESLADGRGLPAPRKEQTIGLSPNFGKECLTGAPWRRTGLTALAIVVALIVYGCWRLGFAHQLGAKSDQRSSRVAESQPPILPSNGILSRSEFPSSLQTSEVGVYDTDATGVPVNYTEPMAYLAKAAASGDPRAEWKLGQAYFEGIGVPRDDRKAVEWFKKAANKGSAEAQNALSELYLNGRGVSQDYVRAYTWASIAAGSQANKDSRLRSIAALMTPLQLQDAQRRISTWVRIQDSESEAPAAH